VEANPDIERLVRNRWLWLAALDPESEVLWELRSNGFVAHTSHQPLPLIAGESLAWYQGKRGFVPPAEIAAGQPSRAPA